MTRNSKTGATRVEYSEPEQLDKILDFLRRARDDAQAGRRRPVPYDPISDKIAMPSAPELAEAHAESRQPTSPASDEPARRVPRQEPSFAAPKPDAASDPAPARKEGDDAPRGATEIAARARRGGIVSDGPAGTRRESHDSPPAPESDPVRLAEAQATPAPSDTPRSREAFAANGSAGPANRTRRPTAGTIGASTTVGPSEPDAARAGEAAKSAPARAPRASTAAPEPARANTAAPSGISLTRIASGSELFQAIAASRPIFVSLAVFSLVINVLMLAGPLFMLQVYDRVMSSGSISTLLVLSALTAAVYGVIGLLELVRSRLTVRIGVEVDRRIGDRVFHASLRQTLDKPGASLSALRDLDQLRQFVGGPGPLTLFDAPWTPVYLVVVFLLHWWLGIAATVGAVVLVAIAWMSETHSRKPLAEANKAAVRSIEIAESGQRNAEAITAMGMLSACRARWQAANAQSLAWQVLASDRLGTLSSISKALRLLLQSMMLAIGAALAIKGDLSAGSIVAATILFGRALAPVEQAVAQWRQFVKARESYDKVGALLQRYPAPPRRTSLPRPAGHLTIENLRVAAPETRTVILAGITFALEPGRLVGVIGPSASGKSTLARALVGLWPPFGGQIRLDGARLDQWDSEELGQHIGYLPQDVELFSGTVRENISRFRADASDEAVVAAAKAAHAHDMIMALPQSYETELGAFGTYLSAGQRQRIGLARALYGNPPLVVLDEPNANLDRSGDEALAAAIDGMRERGQAIVLVSHRVQAIGKADYLLYIEKGVQKAFGPRADVIRYLQGQSGPQPAAAAGASANGQGPLRPQVVTRAATSEASPQPRPRQAANAPSGLPRPDGESATPASAKAEPAKVAAADKAALAPQSNSDR